MGSCFHEIREKMALNQRVEFDQLSLAYGLTKEQVSEQFWLANNMKVNLEGMEVVTEKRYCVNDAMEPCEVTDPRAVVSTRIDILAYPQGDPKIGNLIDYKSGYLEVEEAEDNWQMITQSICVLAHMPQMDAVNAAIAYPRLQLVSQRSDSLGQPRPWTRAELAKLWPTLREICEKTYVDKPNAQTGPWCRYCAYGVCPAWTDKLQNIMADPEKAMEVPKTGQEIDWVKFADLFTVIPVLEDIVDTFKALAKERVRSTGPMAVRGGMFFENRPRTKDEFDTAKTAVVIDKYPELVAAIVHEAKYSKSLLGRAINSPGVATTFDKLMAELQAGGAVTTVQTDFFSFFKNSKATKK